MRFLLSWSGGKDACMCLDTLIKQGHEVVCLITTASKEIGTTFGHGEKREMIRAQAESLDIPVHFIEVEMNTYTETFIQDVNMLKERCQVDAIAFGDLYLPGHREWGEAVAEKTGLKAVYPLWMKQAEAESSLYHFVNSGYQALIIRTKNELGLEKWLGQTIDKKFADELSNTEICPMGEAGEYHTFVYDGPLFKKKITINPGEVVAQETTKRLEIDSFSLTGK
ncbi:uncharacterized protein (TIGR00290 family) [Bacillus pakistanensis]|uniref:Uncharacterized protein (TIGR00290 family) n=1 Tax=Rossellomorea pakistanensis TaxID=992288 RepID=A0ABS2NJ24_9BACI|nr:diphthine--ammonia ligase [Bacillus pakistanensis]MBM7587867.1 uncharacterized protein (TIGR00290 family) [Bacillus pakistanensis]